MATPEQWGVVHALQNFDPTVKNRFNNWQDMFNFDDMNLSLQGIFDESENLINRNTAEDVARGQENAQSRLLSRGITGGSITDDTLSNVAADTNSKKYNALSNLGIGKSKATLDLKDLFNKRKIQTESLAGTTDLANVTNRINQLVAAGQLGNQTQQVDYQGEQMEGTLDDILGGLGDIGSLVSLLMEAGVFSSGGGAAAMASDIRFKENISYAGEENGFNVYDFNYIGDPKKYRGVIAQEIEKINPEAVIMIDGMRYVDYSKIGVKFREV